VYTFFAFDASANATRSRKLAWSDSANCASMSYALKYE
jgi:hypothetical protein